MNSSLILTEKLPVPSDVHIAYSLYVLSSTCLWLLWFTGLLVHLQFVSVILPVQAHFRGLAKHRKNPFLVL